MFLPERLVWGLAAKVARGIRVDTNTGAIKEYMYGAPTKIRFVTTVVERNGKLYFASLRTPTIVILDRQASNRSNTSNIDTDRREEL
jgi:hypothetical protein